MRTHRVLSLLVCMTVFGLLVGADAVDAKKKALPTKFLACNTIWGDTPDERSFRLGNNMICPDDALFIVADNITVDLGNHRITGPDLPGDGTDVAVFLQTTTGVTLRNGVIDKYNRSIFLNEAVGSRIQNLIISDSDIEAIRVFGGHDNVISNNTVILGSDDNDGTIQLDTTERNRVIGNTLARTTIAVSGDRNTIAKNRIFEGVGPGIDLRDGSERNLVSGNMIFGVSLGIGVSGDAADNNTLTSNTLRGNTTAIQVVDGDGTKISKNVATGNGDGLFVDGSANNTVITENNASANLDAGIEVTDGFTGRIVANRANENGDDGIQVAAATSPLVKDNITNFNGYDDGENDNSATGGITALNAVGSNNKAKGNDVPGAEQCNSLDPDLCIDGPPDPPPLVTCDTLISAGRTLRHPLTCTDGIALRVGGNGYTLNLGPHVVEAGNEVGDSAIDVESTASSITITGGVIRSSEVGVRFGVPLVTNPPGAHNITIRGSLVTGNDFEGVLIQGTDLLPNDATITAGRNRIEASTISGNGSNGINIQNAPLNVVQGITLVENSSGVRVVNAERNNVVGNSMTSTGTAIALSDVSGSPQPDRNTIKGNRLVGNGGLGISLANASENKILENIIRGSSTIGLDGIDLTGGDGSSDNLIADNVISGSSGHGIELTLNAQRNRITRNIVAGNDKNGIMLLSNADDNVISSNVANENGADDPDVLADGGIVVLGPVNPSELPDVVSENIANRNGFLSESLATSDNNGFGIAAASDTTGSGNKATGNDNPAECSPDTFC